MSHANDGGRARSARERTLDLLRRSLTPELQNALEDPRTIEVMLNPDGRIWQELAGQPMRIIGSLDPNKAKMLMQTVAGILEKPLSPDQPLLEGEWPLDGSRFAGQIPPVVKNPSFAIRKPASTIIPLQTYVEQGIMTASHAEFIRKNVREKKNILVVGGFGSGKTTLVNAILNEMASTDRIAVIEDTNELQVSVPNSAIFREGPGASISQILRNLKRMRFEKFILGELRGPETLELLDAWNSGQPGGVATVHADDAVRGLQKLVMYTSRHPEAPREIEPLVGDAVHLVLWISKTKNHGRSLRQIIEVLGYENGQFKVKDLTHVQ